MSNSTLPQANFENIDLYKIWLQLTAAAPSGITQVSGQLKAASASITRPADVLAYTAKDVVSASPAAVLSFGNLARVNGGSGYITKIRLMTNQSTNTARYRLHLFTSTITPIADNSPYTLLYSNASLRIAAIDLPALITEGTDSTAAYAMDATIRVPFKCASESMTIYGVLETLDGFTPASEQQFFIELTADVN